MIVKGPCIGTVSHVLLLVRLGVAGEQDAGRAVGQHDGHGVVVDRGEQTTFGVRRRSYDVVTYAKDILRARRTGFFS
jgi:hypothetical protein